MPRVCYATSFDGTGSSVAEKLKWQSYISIYSMTQVTLVYIQ